MSADGRLLLTRDETGALRVWDLGSNMLLGRFGAPDAQYRSPVLSPDGRWIAAIRASEDGVNGTDAADVIDVGTGRYRQVYPSPTYSADAEAPPPPTALAFSPDGGRLAIATSFPYLEPPPPDPKSPEGYLGSAVHVFILDGSAPVRSRYVRSRKVESVPMGSVHALGFLPDGLNLGLVFEDGIVRVFDPAQGKYGKQTAIGDISSLGPCATSADGRWWAVVPWGDGSAPTPITLWDATTGKKATVGLPRAHTLTALAFSGAHLLVATRDSDGKARIGHFPLDGKAALSLVATAPEGITSIAGDPHGRLLLTGTEEGSVTVRESGTGIRLDELPAGGIHSDVAFGAGDGHLLMLRGGKFYEWNLALSPAGTGDVGSASARDILTRRLAPLEEFVQAFAPDERGRPVLLVTRGFSSPLVLLREGAPELVLLPKDSGVTFAPGLTSDGNFAFSAVTAAKQTHMHVWNARTGVQVARLGPIEAASGLHVVALDLRPGGTGRAVFMGLAPNGLPVEEGWEVAPGKRNWQVTGIGLLGLTYVSPSGRRVVTYSGSISSALLTVADLGGSTAPNTFKLQAPAGADMALEHLAFLDDERSARLQLRTGQRLDVDLANGTATPSAATAALPAPRPRPRSAFHTPFDPLASPSGRLRAVARQDGQVEVYSAGSGTPLATLVVPEDRIAPDNWAIFTPDGYYAANSGATRLLGLRRDAGVLPFEQFDVERNRPDLVFERLGSAAPEALARLREARMARGATDSEVPPLERPTPALSVEGGALPRATDQASIDVPVLLLGADPAALQLRVTVNGVPVVALPVVWDPPGGSGSRRGRVHLELIEGPNAIVVSATTPHGIASVAGRVVVIRTSRPPSRRVLFLGIGIEAYADARYTLEFAVDDVEALATLVRTFAGPVMGRKNLPGRESEIAEVDRLEVEAATLTDAAATRAGIASRLEALFKTAGVQDTVIVALSGHGVLDAHRQCWFAPVDMDFAAPERAGLSYRDLDALLATCPARRKVLFMDACHTGAGGDLLARAPGAPDQLPEGVTALPGAKGFPLAPAAPATHILAPDLLTDLFQDLSATSGTVILAAASGEQWALETAGTRHGLFTYALIRGLDAAWPDRNFDNRISVRELQEYVREQVRTLSAGRQVPTFRRAPRESDFFLR